MRRAHLFAWCMFALALVVAIGSGLLGDLLGWASGDEPQIPVRFVVPEGK